MNMTVVLLCLQGKEVIEYYINEILSEGVTNIPTWPDSASASDQTSPGSNTLVGVLSPESTKELEGAVGGASMSQSVSGGHNQLAGPTHNRTDSSSSRGSLKLGATAASITEEAHEKEQGMLGKVQYNHTPVLLNSLN